MDCALDVLDDGLDGLVDPALERHGVGAGGQGLEPFLVDRLGQDGRGGGAVAGGVGGLGGRFLDELGTHVLVGIGQLDLLGDRHAVLGDGRAAPALVDHGIAAARAKRAPNGPGQFRHAAGQLLAGLLIVGQNLRHGGSPWSLSSRSSGPRPPGVIPATISIVFGGLSRTFSRYRLKCKSCTTIGDLPYCIEAK